MNVRIESDFRFSVASIRYTPQGELCITLASGNSPSATRYQYTANLGNWQAEEKPAVSLLQYARDFAASANIKDKTKDSYRLMCNHLEDYGDCPVDKVTTAYIQEFITHLQCQGLKPGTVRLYFQKLACVLHDAYKPEFDFKLRSGTAVSKRQRQAWPRLTLRHGSSGMQC